MYYQYFLNIPKMNFFIVSLIVVIFLGQISFKHSSELVPHVLFCLQTVFMVFTRFSEHSFDDYGKTINRIVFAMETLFLCTPVNVF